MSRKPVRKKTIKDELDELSSMNDFIRDQVSSFQFKINCKFKNKKQKEMYDTIMSNRITFVSGCAGTGKTLVALMAALECIKNKDINILQIIQIDLI